MPSSALLQPASTLRSPGFSDNRPGRAAGRRKPRNPPGTHSPQRAQLPDHGHGSSPAPRTHPPGSRDASRSQQAPHCDDRPHRWPQPEATAPDPPLSLGASAGFDQDAGHSDLGILCAMSPPATPIVGRFLGIGQSRGWGRPESDMRLRTCLGTFRSCPPCQISVRTRISPRSNPHSCSWTTSSRAGPRAPCRYPSRMAGKIMSPA